MQSLEATISNRIAPGRLAARTAALALCVLATAVCGEQGRFQGGITNPSGDTEVPVARIILPGVLADTNPVDLTDSLKFTARATDNIRVLRARVTIRGLGGFTALDGTVLDTTTTSTITQVQKDYVIALPASAAGQLIVVRIDAEDAAGNGGLDSVIVSIEDPTPPEMELRSPSSGVVVPAGGTLPVAVRASDPSGVATMGARIFTTNALGQPIAVAGDSQTYSTATVTRIDTFTISIPAALAPGSYTLHAFAVDGSSSANDTTTAAITVVVADTVLPFGNFQPALGGSPRVAGDSVLVIFRAQDLTGLASLTLRGFARRGVDSLGTTDTVARYAGKTVNLSASAPRDTLIYRYLYATADSTAELVYIEAVITDVGGNSARVVDSVRIAGGPRVFIYRPSAGATSSPTKSVLVEVFASDPQGVRLIGWRATDAAGAAVGADSVFRSANVNGDLLDTTRFIDTLTIPAATPLGTLNITPFAVDSTGDASAPHAGVNITITSSAADATAPAVDFGVLLRAEIDDTIQVIASDPSGVARVGFTATLLSTGASLAADSTALAGDLTEISRSFQLNLPATLRYPAQVVVTAFAVDAIGNRGQAASADTITIVAGRTFALPAGSQIGDAIYNRNRQELYLTNTTYDRLEIFSLASMSFVASIPIGSRPVGIALWPKDTLGNYADTVVVANSGGTNLSIVDVAARYEVRRQRVPGYLVQTVSVTVTEGGGYGLSFREWDLSDRPFMLGTICRVSVSASCDYVRAVYSTSPTAGHFTPTEGRGYAAWINLTTAPTGPQHHFIYEHGSDTTFQQAGDSLQIIAVFDSIPGQQIRDTILGAGYGIAVPVAGTTINSPGVLLHDSSFVRNSGDFTHVIIGEGGEAEFARVVMYDGRLNVTTSGSTTCTIPGTLIVLPCASTWDGAVTDILLTRDLAVNRSARVSSVATNFNGRTNLVRADSIYVLDRLLKQSGMMQISGAAVGMDLHPANDFDANSRGTGGVGGTGNPSNRLVFAARPDSSIDVFDTFFFGRATDTTSLASAIPIPIRNALVGPVRIADVTGATVLFGVTRFGLVVASLPAVTNSLFPVPTFTGSTSSAPRLPRGRSAP